MNFGSSSNTFGSNNQGGGQTNTKNHVSIIPVTVMMLKNSEYDKGNGSYTIDNQENRGRLKIAGKVTVNTENSSRMDLTLNDGTGSIKVSVFKTTYRGTNAYTPNNDRLVSIIGNPSYENGLSFVCQRISRCSPNELINFYLRVIEVHLFHHKGSLPEPQRKTPQKRNTGQYGNTPGSGGRTGSGYGGYGGGGNNSNNRFNSPNNQQYGGGNNQRFNSNTPSPQNFGSNTNNYQNNYSGGSNTNTNYGGNSSGYGGNTGGGSNYGGGGNSGGGGCNFGGNSGDGGGGGQRPQYNYNDNYGFNNNRNQNNNNQRGGSGGGGSGGNFGNNNNNNNNNNPNNNTNPNFVDEYNSSTSNFN